MLQTFKKTGLLPLDNDPASIPRSATAFKTLLDQPSISSLDEIVVAAMKCLHTLSQQLKNSPYGDQGRNAQINSYKQMAQSVVQFASGLRLRLGPDVYRQLSSMSEQLLLSGAGKADFDRRRCFLLIHVGRRYSKHSIGGQSYDGGVSR